MTIQQLLQTKNGEEAAYIIFENNCLYCSHFEEDENHNWHCNSPWHEQICKKDWNFFINHEIDKGWLNGYVRSFGEPPAIITN